MDHQRRAPRGALARATMLGAGLVWAAVAPAQELPRQDLDLSFGATLEREELLTGVLARNPGIAAARQAWEAARQEVPQAISLEDPMASYSLAPLSIASGDARFGDQLRIGQRIPFPGTLRLRGAIASADAAAAEQNVEEVRLRLVTIASLLFDDYYLVARALEINEAHVQLLEDFQSVAVSRYSTGLAPQQAPIQAEVEAAHLLHRGVVLRKERRVLVARLNALLHRQPRASLPPPVTDLVPEEHPLPVAAELQEMALAQRPEVAAQRAQVAARRASVALEKLGFYPDFEVMTSYNSMWGMPEHRWMIGVGVNLPIWRRRVRAEVAAASARLAASERELDRLVDEVGTEVETALAEIEESAHVLHLYRNRVLPAARDGVAAARAGFETGAATMLALIDAERSLRTAELNYHQALADHASRRAELDRALGRLPLAANEPEAPVAAPRPTEGH